MQNLRVFLAIELSAAVKTRANELIDKWSESEATVAWTPKAQMHLTLNFLGDVPVDRTPDVCRIAQEVARNHDSFSFLVKGAGAFPNVDSPRVVWLGVGDGVEPLKALQAELETRLGEAGFPIENRAYAPHLTLGRVKKTAGSMESLTAWVRRTQTYNAGSSLADEVLVLSSILERSGPIYHLVCRAPLGQ